MECKTKGRIVFKVVELERLEIADQHETGEFVFLQSRKVVECLPPSANQVSSGALLFNEEDALPEKINETALFPQAFNRLFERCNSASGDAKNLEEFVIEGLALATFIPSVFPVIGETRRTSPDLVPT